MASRLNSAQPALGAGYELAIAAVVIGGTSLSGGKGTILGTVIGALIMSVLTNGLQILSVPQEWQTVVVGAVILLAVYADVLRNKKQRINCDTVLNKTIYRGVLDEKAKRASFYHQFSQSQCLWERVLQIMQAREVRIVMLLQKMTASAMLRLFQKVSSISFGRQLKRG